MTSRDVSGGFFTSPWRVSWFSASARGLFDRLLHAGSLPLLGHPDVERFKNSCILLSLIDFLKRQPILEILAHKSRLFLKKKVDDQK